MRPIIPIQMSLLLMFVITFASCHPVDHVKQVYIRSVEDDEGSGEEFLNTTISKIAVDSDDNSNNKSIITEKLDNVDDAGATIVSNAANIFGSIIHIASNLFDIKKEAAVRGIHAASKTAEALANSKTADRLLETGDQIVQVAGEGTRRLGETVVEGGRRIQATVSKAGAAAGPAVLETAEVTANGAQTVTRLTICTLVCPLQKEKNKESCRKENCGKIDKSDNLDYYDGDYTGFERQYR